MAGRCVWSRSEKQASRQIPQGGSTVQAAGAQMKHNPVPTWTGSAGKWSPSGRVQEVLLCSGSSRPCWISNTPFFSFSLCVFLFQGEFGSGVETWSQMIEMCQICFFLFLWHRTQGGQSASDVTNTTVRLCLRADKHAHTFWWAHTLGLRSFHLRLAAFLTWQSDGWDAKRWRILSSLTRPPKNKLETLLKVFCCCFGRCVCVSVRVCVCRFTLWNLERRLSSFVYSVLSPCLKRRKTK